jgi:ArsR family transcriptional regulator
VGVSDSPKLHLEPKIKRAKGERCCEPVAYPDIEREQAQRMAAIAKTLADPVRLRLIDVLRKHAGKVCVCELVPLFDLAQPTISHHLRVLRDAGVIECERQGLWSYYYVLPAALDELAVWLGKSGHLTREPDGSRAVRLPA